MSKKLLSIIAITSLSLSIVTSCETRQDAATMLGAIGGGILGSKIGKGDGRLVGAAIGALGGAAFGSWMGENLDQTSRNYHYQTTQTALERAPIGQKREWSNPDNNAHGYIKPTKTYKLNNRYCREYIQTIMIGNKTQEAYGTACRNDDGTWEIINN